MKQKGAWLSATTLTREYSVFTYAKGAAWADDPWFVRSVDPADRDLIKTPAYKQRMAAADPHWPRYESEFIEIAKKNLKKLADAGVKSLSDLGANAAKVFVLVYYLPNSEALFQRFPAVDGSFYYVGGAGINYQQRDNIILAPIRLGVGLRAGASIGYVHYTKTKTLNPF